MFSNIFVILIASILTCAAILVYAVYMAAKSYQSGNDLVDSGASLTEILENSKRLEEVNQRMKEILDKGGK